MNTRKRIVLALVLITLLGFVVTIRATLIKASNLPTPTVGVSCPTPDETDIPICAPGGEMTSTPGLLPTAEAPSLIGTPVGP